MDKFIFGKGNRSVFTVESLLDAMNLHPETKAAYLDHVGNGLSVGGLIPGSKDEVIRLSESTTSIVVMAPDCEVVEVPCECDHKEDDHSGFSVSDTTGTPKDEAVVSTEQSAAEAANPQAAESEVTQ